MAASAAPWRTSFIPLRVNAVAPGMTETPMTAGMIKMPAMREGATRQYPLGDVQTADQVADVMTWLLGDGAARLTGQAISVDGEPRWMLDFASGAWRQND